MKSLLAAAGFLLLFMRPTFPCQAQATRPGPARASTHREAADMVEVEIDSAAFIKAVAINEIIFKSFSGQAFFGLGYAAARYDGLNEMLQQAGYPKVDGNQFSYGGGGSFRFKHVLLGLEGVVYDSKKTDQTHRTELVSANATNYLGYAIFNRAHTQSFTPTLGVTYSSADIILTDQSLTSGSTAVGLLTGPAYTRTLRYRSTGLALGAHYELYPFDAAVLKRCVVGLHLTYSPRMGKGRYYASDFKQEVAGPALNPLLFSTRAVFGFVF
jgi:opacity protein-like surface antigen